MTGIKTAKLDRVKNNLPHARQSVLPSEADNHELVWIHP